MSIQKDLSELIAAGILSQDTADKIQRHYDRKKGSSTNKLFVVFGVLGAILVGLGIILILAHNWDDLSRGLKTFFAFLPLVGGQLLCGFTLIKKHDSIAWRESTSAFLFFAVGASIALVSQIYNLPGNLGAFMLTWMVLVLPLIYTMRSSITSLMYICGITYYGAHMGYWEHPSSESLFYWPLFTSVLPHYYMLYRQQPVGNFLTFHHWLVPLSIVSILGAVADQQQEWMFVAYFSLLSVLYLIGNFDFLDKQTIRNNGYRVIGALGIIGLMLTLSFDFIWEDLRKQNVSINEVISAPEFFISVIFTLLALALLFYQQKGKSLTEIRPLSLIFILFLATFIVGYFSSIAVILMNLYVFAIGVLIIMDGAKKDHIGLLNFGLMVITALVVCRFFDVDLSFVFRGLLFMLVGAGFFVANYWMLKKRRADEAQ